MLSWLPFHTIICGEVGLFQTWMSAGGPSAWWETCWMYKIWRWEWNQDFLNLQHQGDVMTIIVMTIANTQPRKVGLIFGQVLVHIPYMEHWDIHTYWWMHIFHRISKNSLESLEHDSLPYSTNLFFWGATEVKRLERASHCSDRNWLYSCGSNHG